MNGMSGDNAPGVIPGPYTPLEGNAAIIERMLAKNQLGLGFLNPDIIGDWPSFYEKLIKMWKEEDLFVTALDRGVGGGAFSTGLHTTARIGEKLWKTEPFRSIFEPLCGKQGCFDLLDGFLVANDIGEHGMHQDSLRTKKGDATHRAVISCGCVGKTMAFNTKKK